MKKIENLTLEEARMMYRNGEISFEELREVFEMKATNEQKEEYWNCPLFDRSWVIEGYNQKQRDQQWDEFIKSCGE